MAKSPAYQMYARDWLASRSVRFMTDYQRGWYIQLLNEAWDSDPQCMLPDDDEILQRMAGVSDFIRGIPDFNDRWMAVRRMFKRHGNFVCNERQMEEFAKQQLHRKQASDAGKSSAAKRAAAMQEVKDQHFASSTAVERPLNDRCDFVQRDSNSAIASASASADCIKTHTLAENAEEQPLFPDLPPEEEPTSSGPPPILTGRMARDFDWLWSRIPQEMREMGRKADAQKALKKLKADNDLVQAIDLKIFMQNEEKVAKEARKEFAPRWCALATYLNGRRWE